MGKVADGGFWKISGGGIVGEVADRRFPNAPMPGF
jgi:hypothetical protein